MSNEPNFTSVAARLSYLGALTGEPSEGKRAAAIGIGRTTFQHIIKRNRMSRSTAKLVALTTGVRAEWLLTGRGPMRADPTAPSHPVQPEAVPRQIRHETIEDEHAGGISRPAPSPDEFVYVPHMKAVLSAGGGAYPTEEESGELYGFRLRWLRAVSTAIRNLFLMNVVGDSMSPTIDEGDIVLVDSGRKLPTGGSIYAIGIDDVIMVKRLDLLPGAKIRIVSDNTALYSPFVVHPSELRIIGQVLWVGKTLVQPGFNKSHENRR
ncbi:MAG: helix-turn-helix transcriptional regulator [Thermodesulfobacteriota bacterium]